ncbi:hypothetical protein P4S87_25280, partial [Aneurinibacillus aneurinilyticus]|uniref:hypothetical protein n=1 Tax=Aneurinibacillus aneurinilyticus TaxID=1391 RepID=UPI002E249636|nr:hypothetical protein [Aneurinibacillus aneurinilyticus]
DEGIACFKVPPGQGNRSEREDERPCLCPVVVAFSSLDNQQACYRINGRKRSFLRRQVFTLDG